MSEAIHTIVRHAAGKPNEGILMLSLTAGISDTDFTKELHITAMRPI